MKKGMFKKSLLAILLLLTTGALAGCGEKEQTQGRPVTVPGTDVRKEAREAYNATRVYTREQMQAFQKQTETRLDDYKKQIDQLQAAAEKLGGDAKTKAEQQLTALRKKRDEASEKLKALSSSSGNAWEEIKSGIDSAMEALGSACKKAAAEFSKS